MGCQIANGLLASKPSKRIEFFMILYEFQRVRANVYTLYLAAKIMACWLCSVEKTEYLQVSIILCSNA
jgi:hypothetical protein